MILAAAVTAGRAVLTHNVRHFRALADAYARAGTPHHGIVLSNQEAFRELFRRALLLFATRSHEEVDGLLIWIPR